MGKALVEVDFILLPEVAVGDYVVAHSGYAVATVPEETATETLGLLASDDPG
jgi:hydrogenase maturation factor